MVGDKSFRSWLGEYEINHQFCSKNHLPKACCRYSIYIFCIRVSGTLDSNKLFPGTVPQSSGRHRHTSHHQEVLHSPDPSSRSRETVCWCLLSHQHLESPCFLCTHWLVCMWGEVHECYTLSLYCNVAANLDAKGTDVIISVVSNL